MFPHRPPAPGDTLVIAYRLSLVGGDRSVAAEVQEDAPQTIVWDETPLFIAIKKALEVMRAGEERSFVAKAAELYGTYQEALVMRKPQSLFEFPIAVGDTLALDYGGDPVHMVVKAMEGDQVVLDGNHPYVDQDCDVWLKWIR